MPILPSARRGGNPKTVADAFAQAVRTGVFDSIAPTFNPRAIFYQVAILASRSLVQKFWSRDCDVLPTFHHWGRTGHLMAIGAGAWFELVHSQDALAFCVAHINRASDGHRELTPLASWLRANTVPGGGMCWCNPHFQFKHGGAHELGQWRCT